MQSRLAEKVFNSAVIANERDLFCSPKQVRIQCGVGEERECGVAIL